MDKYLKHRIDKNFLNRGKQLEGRFLNITYGLRCATTSIKNYGLGFGLKRKKLNPFLKKQKKN